LSPAPAGEGVVKVPLGDSPPPGVEVVPVSPGVEVVPPPPAPSPAGEDPPSPPPPPGWQADRAVIKPTRSKTMTFDFTVNILTIFQFFGLSPILTGNSLFRSPVKERTFWRIFHHES
jgi:hypothetical protein